MSNVVHLNITSRNAREGGRLAQLLAAFAAHRRIGDDVFWLKENAELLNILECSGPRPEGLAEALAAAHGGFYADAEKRLGFFPQYYRFLLSICLDLEDLGMPGHKGEALAAWIADQGLADAEMSDLQRAEARRLMLRRGVDPMAHDGGLDARLHRFISRAETFALPNKKAAYELTHTVFYLSEYGRRDPGLGREAARSLEFAGTLAFLDLNADLLAEVCIAMRHAGLTPPAAWEGWLARHTRAFAVEAGDHLAPGDDYHEFFVCNWLEASAGRAAFARDFTAGRMGFFRPETGRGPLREMSECMFRLEGSRQGDWQKMRPRILEELSEGGRAVLAEAEAASSCFDAFFEGFARVAQARVAS